MKKILLILSISILIAGCKTTKRLTVTDLKTEQKTETRQQVQTTDESAIKADKAIESTNIVQSDKSTDLTTTTTTTEYYPPTLGSGKDKGAIKSETVTKTERQDKDKSKAEAKASETDKGTVNSKNEVNSDTDHSTNSVTDQQIKNTEKPAPDPHRWMWIFGILVVVASTVFYFRNSPAAVWLKKIVSSIWG